MDLSNDSKGLETELSRSCQSKTVSRRKLIRHRGYWNKLEKKSNQTNWTNKQKTSIWKRGISYVCSLSRGWLIEGLCSPGRQWETKDLVRMILRAAYAIPPALPFALYSWYVHAHPSLCVCVCVCVCVHGRWNTHINFLSVSLKR